MSEIIGWSAGTRRAPRRRHRRSRRGLGLISMALLFAVTAGVLAANPGLVVTMARIGDEALPKAEAVVDSGFALCATAHNAPNCVVDGDTVHIGGVRIRLADINAPETHQPQCAAEADRGARATSRLLSIVNEGPVEILPYGDRDEDRYGRKLRILARDHRSLGDILVAEGLARPWQGHRRSWCG